MMEILVRQSIDGDGGQLPFHRNNRFWFHGPRHLRPPVTGRANDTAPFQRKSGATLTTCALYPGGSGSGVRRATNTHANTYMERGDAHALLEHSRTHDRTDRAEQKDAVATSRFMSSNFEHTFYLQSTSVVWKRVCREAIDRKFISLLSMLYKFCIEQRNVNDNFFEGS